MAAPPRGGVAAPPAIPVAAPVQQIPLIQLRSQASLQLFVKGKKLILKSPDDFVLESRRLDKEISLTHSGWVFVGYGVTIPALGWDNYRDLDVRGKTVVILSGAPPIPDGARVSSNALLSHPVAHNLGHWRAKFDNARRHGAAVAVILHDPKAEGFAYDRLADFRESVMVRPADDSPDPLVAFGWVPESRARGWFKRAGMDWEAVRGKAQSLDFQPMPLPVQSDLQVSNRWRETEVTVPR